MKQISVNKVAMGLVQRLMDSADDLRVKVTTKGNGSTVIDAGVDSRGGLEAGRLIGEVCMGGLGSVALSSSDLPGIPLPSVEVVTDHPVLACILSQLAGWSIKAGKFRAMGSGPARALAHGEAVYDEYDYVDEHSEAVIVLETSAKPKEKASEFLSRKCGVDPKDLYMILTPTASLAGAVQISARIVETGMHKMHTMGIGLEGVLSGQGTCPVAPLAGSDLTMMGRTNDAMLYGGRTLYVFEDAGGAVEKINSIPACSSPDYGKPFEELFRSVEFDFYKLDPGLFSPAVVHINDVHSGKVLSAGDANLEVLRKSFGIS
jgi:methenyltetrahydromethanopterin cyclohydrolase